MGRIAAKNVQSTKPRPSAFGSTTINHQIIGVEFIPGELTEVEGRALPLQVRFNLPIQTPVVVQDEETKQRFLNKRRQHDFGFFKSSQPSILRDSNREIKNNGNPSPQ